MTGKSGWIKLAVAVVGIWLAAPVLAGDHPVLGKTKIPGGLCVQLGGGDGKETLTLSRDGKFLVHRLERDRNKVRAIREFLVEKKFNGSVTVEVWSGKDLPYIDNLVNLLVADDAGKVPEAEMLRVLAPGGEAHIKEGNRYKKVTKPWPEGVDFWTHVRHGPDAHLVSKDRRSGVPKGVQWIAGPTFPLDTRKTSTQSFVSAGGKVFYLHCNVLENLGNGGKAPFLVARDAFNGVILWKKPWEGPVALGEGRKSRQLATDGNRVYAFNGEKGVALDADSGREIQHYAVTGNPKGVLLENGRVYFISQGEVKAFEAQTGKFLWECKGSSLRQAIVGENRVFVLAVAVTDGSNTKVRCYDAKSGKEVWSVDARTWMLKWRKIHFQFARDGYVALGATGGFYMLSAEDGKCLWKITKEMPDLGSSSKFIYQEFMHWVFYEDGLVWVHTRDVPRGEIKKGLDLWTGYDPNTGEKKKEIRSLDSWASSRNLGKLGCQQILVTPEYISIPRQAALIDKKTGKKHLFPFIRGGCALGAIPSNGLTYVHPHACGCFSGILRGFIALHPGEHAVASGKKERLEKGEASAPSGGGLYEKEWPMHRQNALRSGATPDPILPALNKVWTTDIAAEAPSLSTEAWHMRLGNTITAPVIAGGKVFVAEPNTHRVLALNAASGKTVWQFVAGGRVDTPPTLYQGLCLFGAHDGWVYALNAASGKMVWRHQTAPADRRMVAYGQVESVWPVAGSILIQDGLAYASSGRAAMADGGMQVVALEPKTGRLVWQKTINGKFFGLLDYPVGDGEKVYLSNWVFDPKSGDAKKANRYAVYLRGGQVGLMDASWTRMNLALRPYVSDWVAGRSASGQMLAFALPEIYGFRVVKGKGELFAVGKSKWQQRTKDSRQVEAMVLSPKVLFVAGPVDRMDRKGKGGFLEGRSLSDGKSLHEIKLDAPPVWDGMAASGGHLYVSTEDGKVTCFVGKK